MPTIRTHTSLVSGSPKSRRAMFGATSERDALSEEIDPSRRGCCGRLGSRGGSGDAAWVDTHTTPPQTETHRIETSRRRGDYRQGVYGVSKRSKSLRIALRFAAFACGQNFASDSLYSTWNTALLGADERPRRSRRTRWYCWHCSLTA